MGHVTKELPWCSIDIDTTAGKILLQERWQYSWLVAPPFRRWTAAEMQAFHQRVERAIWAAWSNRAFLSVTGTSPFAKRFSGRGVPVFMDVRRVLAKPQWTVTVTKVPEGRLPRSKMSWWGRRITLDTNDVMPRSRCIGPAPLEVCATQIPVAHEFGHTIGNVDAFARGDEYELTSPHVADVASIMHYGLQLRKRHFDQLLMELGDIIPDTTFGVGRLI